MPEVIWEAERSLWLGGRLAYATHMAADFLLALPPVGVLEMNDVLDSISSVPRWQAVELHDRRMVGGGETMVLGYRATATRDRASYRALCTSTWRREGGLWKLIQHQQSPL